MKKIFIVALICFLWDYGYSQFISNGGLPVVNRSLVSSNGTWDNQGYLLNNGTIRMSEYFVNTGTLDTASAGGFILDFGVNWTVQLGGTHIGFIVKNGPGEVTTTVGIHVKDSLILNEGIWHLTNAGDTLTLEKGCIVHAADTAFVEGMIARSGKGNLLFPLGKDGISLPLMLHKAEAEKIIASVLPAPGGYTEGAGVNALIDFPYAWRIQEKIAADTAAFVEVRYPKNLAPIPDPVIARATAENTYVSMGARLITEDTLNRVAVRSYSRGLVGLFTIARGFAVDGKTDSLALVAFYDSTGGPQWGNQGNWLVGPIDSWSGVKRAGQSVISVTVRDNQLAGVVPDAFTDLNALQKFDIANNAVTAIPNFIANAELDTLDVSNNRLTFATLEPNSAIPLFYYDGQAPFGTPMDSLVAVSTPLTLSLKVGGDSTHYQWRYNGNNIEGANNETYTINSVNKNNMGDYVLEATNSKLPNLTLTSTIQHFSAYATISGKLMIDESTGALAGTLRLLEISPEGYDSTAVVDVESDGSYFLDKVILSDYLILGFPDTVSHEGALPTYYDQKLFWEEADTVFLEANLDSMDIIAAFKPLPPTGDGIINGIVQEDDGTSGRQSEAMANKRVAGAGVSARKVERGGRAKEETLTLISYVFTNDNGEFSMTDLPEGDYRMNIQYPGYPMDTTSDVTITIGGPLESVVSVEANVADGKINVRKLTVTGIQNREDYQADVFPNPAVEKIQLRFGAESINRTVSITDSNGKQILFSEATSKEAEVSVTHLPKGLYVLKVKDKKKEMKTFKIIIE
jgi:hypothetical protein